MPARLRTIHLFTEHVVDDLRAVVIARLSTQSAAHTPAWEAVGNHCRRVSRCPGDAARGVLMPRATWPELGAWRVPMAAAQRAGVAQRLGNVQKRPGWVWGWGPRNPTRPTIASLRPLSRRGRRRYRRGTLARAIILQSHATRTPNAAGAQTCLRQCSRNGRRSGPSPW